MLQRRLLASSLALAALLAAASFESPAHAQQQRGPLAPGPAAPGPQRGPAPPAPGPNAAAARPYREVAVTLPAPSNDPSFAAFRKQLADIANSRDRAALTRLLVPTNFFWMGERGDKANRRKSSIDNLASAIDLDAKDGSGWEVIAHAAEEASLEPIPQRRGIFCSPASPMFDERLADQVARDTGTQPSDWAFPTKAGLDVRASAESNAPIIGKLGMHLIRVIEGPQEAPGGGPESAFIRIVTPAGKVGYVEEEFLSGLNFDQICYLKDAAGWKIAGYAGDHP
jgi:hypothetical protein